jgi:cobalt transporter subunit CbtB
MTTPNLTLADQSRAMESGALVPALMAILLGLFILSGTGMVEASALHDAAHDSRHSLAFPCH